MSLMSAMSTATSGIDADNTELAVISNNIANASTVGYKDQRTDFETALSQSMVGAPGQVGLGTTASVQTLVTEGSLTTTGNPTDLALQGNGYFMVNGSYEGQTGTFYTRDGEFSVNSSGYLVNQAGLEVQGFTANAAGQLSGVTGNLLVGNAQVQPVATTTVTMQGNLQSSAAYMTFNPASPTTTSNFSTDVTVYDSLGAAHAVQIFFTNTPTGWQWNAMTDGGGLTGGAAGTLTSIANGTLTFNAQGALTAETQASNFNPLGATNPQALAFNFGTATGAGGTGLDGVTQFASSSATTAITQDGYAAGDLSSIQVGQNGTISGVFSNGETRVLGQVAVAGFPAPDQLSSIGGNLYSATQTAGQPVIGAPGSGGLGSVTSGALEQSTVDLSTELVNMIEAQHAFEANSKTITTADTLLSELIQMKR